MSAPADDPIDGESWQLSLARHRMFLRLGCCFFNRIRFSTEESMNPSTRGDETPLNPGDEGPAEAPGVGEDLCQACHGTGTVEGVRCIVCGGTGTVLQGISGG